MEENSEIQEDLGNGGKVKNWLQDNIRIILSVLIVLTIMAGIYSYSKRTVVSTDTDNGTEINLVEADKENDDADNSAVVVVGEDDESNKVEVSDKDTSAEKLSVEVDDQKAEEVKQAEAAKQAEEAKKAEEVKQAEAAKQAEEAKKAEEVKQAEAAKQAEEAKKAEEVKQAEESSQETNASFDEVAGAGDSLTVLARRATKHYLEKNPTEGLSAEHKIYVEDYLRKQIKYSKNIRMGEKVSFSKDLISQAVNASKNLNDKQLKNLQKYSVRVSGL